MKLRLHGNSIRLRLRQGEVRRLVERGVVEERTEFAEAAFVYALRVTDATGIGANISQNGVEVTVPRGVARQWASGEQVGIEGSQPAPGGKALRIVVEKDFECIDAPPGESQEDAYPNPRAGKC
jgi:hypothetical protein